MPSERSEGAATAALLTVAAKPELATATERGEQGLGRISGAGSAHRLPHRSPTNRGLALTPGECHMLLALESVEC